VGALGDIRVYCCRSQSLKVSLERAVRVAVSARKVEARLGGVELRIALHGGSVVAGFNAERERERGGVASFADPEREREAGGVLLDPCPRYIVWGEAIEPLLYLTLASTSGTILLSSSLKDHLPPGFRTGRRPGPSPFPPSLSLSPSLSHSVFFLHAVRHSVILNLDSLIESAAAEVSSV
jgi:hypothetical protein